MVETVAANPLNADIVARLITRQFPELAGKAVAHQAQKGTDNHIFRIGEDLCARFPKAPWASGTASREVLALPRFAGAPIRVPKVYGLGLPDAEFPLAWSVLSWLPGTPLEDCALTDSIDAARQIAGFFAFVRNAPADPDFLFSAQNNGRGAPLETRSGKFRSALAQLSGIDAVWAERLWSHALRAGAARADVWLHGDVHPGNVLAADGQISGIIDWGLCGVGDGACDLLTAWAMFDRAPREVFRRAMNASDAEWMRGAGWALSMAVIYLPYAYENGLRCDMSERMIARLKEDFA